VPDLKAINYQNTYKHEKRTKFTNRRNTGIKYTVSGIAEGGALNH
jgi:hypothetical protein